MTPDEDASAAPAMQWVDIPAALSHLLEQMQGLLQLHLELLTLEARRAGWGLVAIATLCAAAGLLFALSCVGLTVALALWLIEQGTRASLAVLLSCVLNVAGVLTCICAIQREARSLTFAVTRKSLRKRLFPSEELP